jgi:hypothetical protein
MAINFKKRPPRTVLERFGAFVSSDPPFRSWCRLKQSIYREQHGWACGTDGRIDEATGRPRLLGNYLVESDARAGRNFLNEEIALAARERIDARESGDNIEAGRLFSNMLTSQTLCFNLFLRQQRNLALATKTWSAVFENEVAAVLDVKVEHSPGRRHAQLGIGDKSAFDAFVLFERPDGSRGIFAIETKYTDCFSPAPPLDKRYFPLVGNSKSDIERGRDLLVAAGTMTVAGWSRASAMPTQQLWRTHALAESMRSPASATHVSYLVLHAAGDDECTCVLPDYELCLSDAARAERRFRQLTLESLVATARTSLADEDRTWLDEFNARYLDWSPVLASGAV